MHHLVFTYGTLRLGQNNHHYMSAGKYQGEFTTPPCYTLFDLGRYPALVNGGSDAIVGEVYLVDENQLAHLDKLEGVPDEYRREKIATSFGTAWVYLYQDRSKLDKVIPSGDWCKR
ncbi:gamma-glutamylcyclotransferase [Vibrio sp. S4M6]|uniref:gamma-glutamylcyclotransferase family protein n=1 Tax=Vibrio sinus TaxID=2946865 RepID=UPI00202A69AD|nr:gamma-glutamylcyclotransferase family protein [Vibrio sinus]MCL9780500.1 gamma-glutamylcyclotransferase [Vibrio sinus]